MKAKNFFATVAMAAISVFNANAAVNNSEAVVANQAETTTEDKIGVSVDKYEVVKSGATDQYFVTFRGGVEAKITVDGDGDSDLDLYVYDENGNLIESDTDSTDYCVVRWTPKWTGKFKIRIVNRGKANLYHLLIP